MEQRHKLNEALINYSLLRILDFSLSFTLHVDASETGLLSQSFKEKGHPVLLISRIKWAIKELQYYLAGWHFTLVTDHVPLLCMAKAKYINARETQ